MIVGTVLRGQQLDVVVDGGMDATIITGRLNFTDGTTTFNSATLLLENGFAGRTSTDGGFAAIASIGRDFASVTSTGSGFGGFAVCQSKYVMHSVEIRSQELCPPSHCIQSHYYHSRRHIQAPVTWCPKALVVDQALLPKQPKVMLVIRHYRSGICWCSRLDRWGKISPVNPCELAVKSQAMEVSVAGIQQRQTQVALEVKLMIPELLQHP
ncbi:hypothetical protein KIW84_031906 [Lathyrus oleraceus]|uniref:Uncharacterized protein n=1 Tax=Pisum sativum TaxID=3888 RepID=A0A9D4XW74_PEA|nr:hypothetical protein KIW84_031905 [Pisum sativum]KAI5426280.1 hypothetical protein KIW84_031906 [Pisum sativum]